MRSLSRKKLSSITGQFLSKAARRLLWEGLRTAREEGGFGAGVLTEDGFVVITKAHSVVVVHPSGEPAILYADSPAHMIQSLREEEELRMSTDEFAAEFERTLKPVYVN